MKTSHPSESNRQKLMYIEKISQSGIFKGRDFRLVVAPFFVVAMFFVAVVAVTVVAIFDIVIVSGAADAVGVFVLLMHCDNCEFYHRSVGRSVGLSVGWLVTLSSKTGKSMILIANNHVSCNHIIIQSFHHHEDASLALWALFF